MISVVLPVYNAASYLSKALDSILKQTYVEWELILVDDGSKDESGEICEDYAKQDSRITVIHKQNEGCSAARQTGMGYVKGQYVLHVDADDWMEPVMLERLVKLAERTDADLVWCDAFCNDSGGWRFRCEETPEDMIRAILGQKMWGVLWNKMIKTEIAKQWGIVPREVAMWEDVSYIIPCLLHCNKVAYEKTSLYHYNIDNQESMVHKLQSKNMAIDYTNAVNHLINCIKDSGRYSEFLYEIRYLQLFAIRDYIDDKRFIDYDKFINTYPDAISHIWEYDTYPNRLKICSWLILNKMQILVPIVCKVDGVLRRLGLSKQY